MGMPYDGGPAFPVNDMQRAHDIAMAESAGIEDSAVRERVYIEARGAASRGMSKREFFAGLLMAAELRSDNHFEDQMVANAVQCADALVRALNAPPEPQPPAITYLEQCAIAEHPKLVAVLERVQQSPAFATFPSDMQEEIRVLLEDFEIPF